LTEPLSILAPDQERAQKYAELRRTLDALLTDEDDWVSAMATVVCELHHAFAYYDWTGFYRVIRPGLLAVGPYQGGHGCLRIAFDRGVCGAAARTRETQRVDDVATFPDHIACSSTTRSELVVPVIDRNGELMAVLDIDSDTPAAFSPTDARELEALCAVLGTRYGALTRPGTP
jgi:GAF domain-containing protein